MNGKIYRSFYFIGSIGNSNVPAFRRRGNFFSRPATFPLFSPAPEKKIHRLVTSSPLPRLPFNNAPNNTCQHFMNWTIFHEQVFPIRHKLYRFALRITGSVHEAEDVVQEVLEKVWKTSADHSATVQNWEAWCMTLTRNRSLDKTRSQSLRRTAPLENLSERRTDTLNPAEAAESNDLTENIKRMMQELPEKQRLVMHLRDIEELTYDEIAETLSITLDQVKINLHRARKTIRTMILERERISG